MCPPMWAHWRHLANTIEVVLPSAHPSPQTKRQIDRFSHFCTANGRRFVYSAVGVFPPVRAHHQNGTTNGSAVFAQVTADCLCFTNGPPLASKLPVPMGMWTPSNTWFLGLTRVLNPNGISRFCRANDASRWVTIDHIYVRL